MTDSEKKQTKNDSHFIRLRHCKQEINQNTKTHHQQTKYTADPKDNNNKVSFNGSFGISFQRPQIDMIIYVKRSLFLFYTMFK